MRTLNQANIMPNINPIAIREDAFASVILVLLLVQRTYYFANRYL